MYLVGHRIPKYDRPLTKRVWLGHPFIPAGSGASFCASDTCLTSCVCLSFNVAVRWQETSLGVRLQGGRRDTRAVLEGAEWGWQDAHHPDCGNHGMGKVLGWDMIYVGPICKDDDWSDML